MLAQLRIVITVGTTKKYLERHNVIHNPEIITARNAIKDFANSERNIVGGDIDLCVDFVAMFEKFFPQIPSIITTSDESEAIKYFSNTFLAYKVEYFNKIYDFWDARSEQCLKKEKRKIIGVMHVGEKTILVYL